MQPALFGKPAGRSSRELEYYTNTIARDRGTPRPIHPPRDAVVANLQGRSWRRDQSGQESGLTRVSETSKVPGT